MSDNAGGGFLRRWSSRKSDARQAQASVPETAQHKVLQQGAETHSAQVTQSTQVDGPIETSAASAPTLDDVAQLSSESDFSAFVRHEVPADVKNAAMKKLFADPHFNVMDGLDVYIDDYSQPDPLSPAVLRQMASAQFLNLVDEPPASPAPSGGVEAQSDTLTPSVAQCELQHPAPDTLDHDHADMRLQPDPSPGSQDTGSEPV